MYSYIIGDIKYIQNDTVVLENNGIGYKIQMSLMDIKELNINETYKIYTEYIVREDSVNLYGFVSLEEQELFLNLTSVSSVGPKAALSILSTLYVIEVKKAIVTNDTKLLSQAPGVGSKTASRIILELSDKIELDDLDEIEVTPKNQNNMSDNYEFALEALVNLGYPKNQAEKALGGIDLDQLNLSQIVREALKKM